MGLTRDRWVGVRNGGFVREHLQPDGSWRVEMRGRDEARIRMTEEEKRMSLSGIERFRPAGCAARNCRNCGAPPRGDRCPYCGTETGSRMPEPRVPLDKQRHGLLWTPTPGQKMSV